MENISFFFLDCVNFYLYARRALYNLYSLTLCELTIRLVSLFETHDSYIRRRLIILIRRRWQATDRISFV